jgi:hypothetical protein
LGFSLITSLVLSEGFHTKFIGLTSIMPYEKFA